MNEEMPWLENSTGSEERKNMQECTKMEAEILEMQKEAQLVKALLKTEKEITMEKGQEANELLEKENKILQGVIERLHALNEELKQD
jgi:hypothetical protein